MTAYNKAPEAIESSNAAVESTRASSRKNRVYVFREFIRNTYALEPNSTILDIAGGKGDLSWLLSNIDGWNGIICDPRSPSHGHLIRSVRYLRDHPDEAKKRAVKGLPTYQPLATLITQLSSKENYSTPHNLRLFIDDKLVQSVRNVLHEKENGNGDNAYPLWEAFWKNALKRGKTIAHSNDNGNSQILDARAALTTILSANLVVGFHPDQATEACIDLAYLLRIPFAVVPCCVFPSEFPNRFLPQGKKVRVYHEFVEYLKCKHDRIRVDTLDFFENETARNIVLYTLPQDML